MIHMEARIAAALILACTVANEGCVASEDRRASDSVRVAERASHRPAISAATVESLPSPGAPCLSSDSLFVYTDEAAEADERTGDVSGTRVTLHRRSDGWSGAGIRLAGPEGIDPTLERLMVDPVGGTIRFRMPLGRRERWVVQGRIDCDSISASAHPASAPTAITRLLLHRVRKGS